MDFDLLLAYAAFLRGQEVHWSFADLKDPFFSYRWHTGEVVVLAERRVQTVSGRLTVGSCIIIFGFRLLQFGLALMLG